MTSLFIASLAFTTQFVATDLGPIAVHIQAGHSARPPILLLHGVYFDHHLWEAALAGLQTNRTIIALDMPLHGQSQPNVRPNWTLAQCADMVVEVLNQLEVPKVVGIGHSWGSMTLLRAAHQHPERFQALGLCNMPLRASTPKRRRQFRMQHLMLPFRRFYTQQVAKALYGPQQLANRPELLHHLQRSMGLLSPKAVRATDRAVIIQADDGLALLEQLAVPALGLKGEADYVAQAEGLSYTIVPGGHVSPLEVPEAVRGFIGEVLAL